MAGDTSAHSYLSGVGNEMYITINGCLAIMHPQDHSVALGSVNIGDTIGELALLDVGFYFSLFCIT